MFLEAEQLTRIKTLSVYFAVILDFELALAEKAYKYGIFYLPGFLTAGGKTNSLRQRRDRINKNRISNFQDSASQLIPRANMASYL